MTGFGFWTPLFLAGAALVILPWLIHRIRRPERDTVTFGSLMFIPDVRQEVIERRRVQHPLLMLLRMLLLLLLALAFARPYLFAGADTREAAERAHLLLVDRSLSVSGSIDRIRDRAHDILADLPASHPVGLITFDRGARVEAPLRDPSDPDAGGHAAVADGLRRLAPGHGGTDYVNALTFAERHLLESTSGDTTTGLTLHLITDFQESGLPSSTDGWRLSSRIDLVPHEIDPPRENLAVSDLVLSRREDGFGLRARVRNTGAIDASAILRVHVDGRPIRTVPVSVARGDSRQVALDLDLPRDEIVTGRLQLDADDLPGDNTRYFAANPPRRPRIAVHASPETARFVKAAAAADRWDARDVASPAEPGARLLVADAVGRDHAVATYRHVERGGALLLVLDPDAAPDAWNTVFAGAAGVRLADRPHTGPLALTTVDLKHPVFAPLAGPRFNDFSAIRYTRHRPAVLDGPAAVLARFEDGRPAIVETRIGEGRVILWLGGLAPSATNWTRSPRFVPVLRETVGYLVDDRPVPDEYLVGQPPPVTDLEVRYRAPDGGTSVPDPALATTRPGWLLTTEAGRPVAAAAVNFDPAEADLTRIPVAEFRLRTSRSVPDVAAAGTGDVIPGEPAPRIEHGFAVLSLALLALLAENVVAARLRND